MAPTPRGETIHQHRLANGLRLLFEPMPWLPTRSVTLLLPFGSSVDAEGREGTAVVLHDWLQRGAGDLDSRQHSDALEALGVRRGGHAGRETSSLGASFLARDTEAVLPLLASMVTAPRLEEGEFEPARELALQELHSLSDAPTQRLFEALLATFLEGGAGRSPYGSEEGLRALTSEGVRGDARARLAADGAVLAVAGGDDAEGLVRAVEDAFGAWQGGSVPLPEPRPRSPHRGHVQADSAQLQIGLVFPSVAADDPDVYLFDIALQVLAGNMGARLFTEVREKRGLVYSVAAFRRALRGFGYTLAYAGTTPERADETLRVVLAEFERLREGVTEDELRRARTGALSSIVMHGESSGARASRLASDVFLQGRPRTLEEIRYALEAIDLPALNAYLRDHPMGEPTVLTLGPGPIGAEAAA